MTQEILNYFKGDILAAETYLSKYKASTEDNPEQTLKRIANTFIAQEKVRINAALRNMDKNFDNLSDKGKNYINKILGDHTFLENHINSLFSNFKYVVPGGSVLENAGLQNYSSLSNCFVIEQPQDSYASIMKNREYSIQLMKRRKLMRHYIVIYK